MKIIELLKHAEMPPLVEIYADRPYGGLLSGLSLEECLSGRSMPRNRELMRVFRDMELVEHLGSGMRRILKAYDSSIVHISEHFFEIRFPAERGLPEVTPEVTRMLKILDGEMSRSEIMSHLALKDEKHFREAYQQAGIALGVIEMTIPDKPQSRNQKYRLTAAGRKLLSTTKGNKHD